MDVNDRERMIHIRNNGLAAPIIGLMGSVAAPDSEAVSIADSLGYFRLGSTYSGSPSVEELLARDENTAAADRWRTGFTLWVTNEVPAVAGYLAGSGRRIDEGACRE